MEGKNYSPGNCLIIVLILLQCYLQVLHAEEGDTSASTDLSTALTFRSLYKRIKNSRLSIIPARREIFNNTTPLTLEKCAERCTKETEFECKSFDFDNGKQTCLLQAHNKDDLDVHLITQPYFDHYETNYIKKFNRLPNHVVTLHHDKKIEGVSEEACARRCILEVEFKCQGFDYEAKIKVCWLTTNTPASAGGALLLNDATYYERMPQGALSRFVNYGFGSLRTMSGTNSYFKVVKGELEECAQYCLDGTPQGRKCLSFDYTFGDQTCHLSEYIAANVQGISTNYRFRVMHYELKEDYLRFFYPLPYSVLLANNHKTYKGVTPNRCARMCMEEETFICRSFDYQIQDGTCLLSSKTGSDVGGLFTQGLSQVHHFEMKPMLDCGGNLTEHNTGFASPNWPRNYAPHESCQWRIKVPKHKVIHFKFIYFALGLQTLSPCHEENDRLIFRENLPETVDEFCIRPHTKTIISKTNEMTVNFTSRGGPDEQGFRVFYTADWPCDVTFTKYSGEFASSRWPENYPPGTRCSWQMKAPYGYKVKLMFTQFELEPHAIGTECHNRYDYVSVHDGPSFDSPQLGRYCGANAPFTLFSTGREMYVTFFSDEQIERQGFHAKYLFESRFSSPDGSSTFKTGPRPTLGVYTTPSVAFTNPNNIIPSIKTVQNQTMAGNTDNNVVKQWPLQSSKTTNGANTVMIAIICGLLVLVLLIIVVLFLVCRYYRKRVPHRRNQPNYSFAAESEALNHKPGDKTEDDQTENGDGPYASIEFQPLTVNASFSNPLYGAKHEQQTGVKQPLSPKPAVPPNMPRREPLKTAV
ncbi:unnamed protein product [Owenia fusiformis]|uniref:Uncharacterized protein n=1 Tax=Owenia fusiformis TaxID=6347 RepID=A0A8J1U031_OWEFU|nr:unnamed protein product [Owenia fusiformis]